MNFANSQESSSPAEGTCASLTFGPCANCGHDLGDHLDGLACYAGTTVNSEFACDCAEWVAPAPVSPGEAETGGDGGRCAVQVGPRLATSTYDLARYRIGELTTPMGWRLGDVIARLVLDSNAVLPAPVAAPSAEDGAS